MSFSVAACTKLLLHVVSATLTLGSTGTAEVWKSGAVVVDKPTVVRDRLSTVERDLRTSRAAAANFANEVTKEKQRTADLEKEASIAKERVRQLEAYIQTSSNNTINIDKILPPSTIATERSKAPASLPMDQVDEAMSKPTVRLPLVLLQTFAAISLGYFCKEFRMIVPENGDTRGLDFFVGKIAFPMIIFRTVATANISAIDFRVVLACTLGKVVVMLATWFFTYFAYGRGTEETRKVGERILTSTVFSFFTVASNDFGIGFPVILALYGSESSMIVYIAANALVNAVFFQPLAMVLFEVGRSVKSKEDGSDEARSSGSQSVVKRIFLNPIMIWTILGIVYQSGSGIWYNMMHMSADMRKFVLPHPLSDVIDLFTAPFAMLALFQTGLSLQTTRITFWPGFLVVMKVIICAYCSFMFSNYIMGVASATYKAETALHNFTFFYGMIPSSTAPLVFASEFDPSSEGIIATAILLGLALAGPNIFITALFLSDDAKDRTGTLIDVQTEMAHLGVPVSVFFLCFLLTTWREWRTGRRFAIAVYGLTTIMYLGCLLTGQRYPDICLGWPEHPWSIFKMIFSWWQNYCLFIVFYFQWLLATGCKKSSPSVFAALLVLSACVFLAVEPFTMNEVCSLHLSHVQLSKMAAWRGACVVITILLTMKGVQCNGAIMGPGIEEDADDPNSPCTTSSAKYGGCYDTRKDSLHNTFEAYNDDQGTSTMKFVVIAQSLRMVLQGINTSSVLFQTKVMGSYTQMVIIESILEHGQISFLVLAILCDSSFKGMITRILDKISKAMGQGQSNVNKFFSPTAVL